jgi:dUTP pyrophosphatase
MRIKLSGGGWMPVRATAGSSGYDLCGIGDIVVRPGSGVLIDTGVHLEIPMGVEAQVRPRSSISKLGIIVPMGTVDSDYRGSIKVLLLNVGPNTLKIENGRRIAQLVFARVEHPTFEVVEELDDTERGSGGFGSTGR